MDFERALRLATLWDLKAAHRNVANTYESTFNLTPWESISIGRAARNVDWMIEGFAYMICSASAPRLEDGEAMGWDIFVKVMNLRETRQKKRGEKRSLWERRVKYGVLQRTQGELVAQIREIFHVQLSAVVDVTPKVR